MSNLNYLAEVLSRLHAQWKPHPGQVKIGKALFGEGKRYIFVQCGRKWGKSEFLIYTLTRWAMCNSGAQCYYFAPFQKQAREIIWQRLRLFIPKDWIKDENKTEGRITFHNDSFIKIDGSDNYEAFRGITPDIVAYDEFKDFKPEFHVAMEPNLGPKRAPLIVVGTPPDIEGQYTQLAEEFRADKEMGFWIEAPSHENPHNDTTALEKMQKKLIERGEPDTWEREYLGRFVKGGARSIFPMLNRARHIVDQTALRREWAKELNRLQWFMIADPGTTSVFGVLIASIHPYTRKIVIWDEVYETNAAFTTTGQIWPIISNKAALVNPFALPNSSEWFRIYDEAAAWFNMESIDRYGVGWAPTQKAASPKEVGLSLIKDLLLNDAVQISSSCQKLIWEMENYALDQNGRIPKKHDHLIDCFRYMLHAANYTVVKRAEPKQQVKQEMRRGYSLEEDLRAESIDLPDDWYE